MAEAIAILVGVGTFTLVITILSKGKVWRFGSW